MICHNTKRYVCVVILLVFLSCQSAYTVQKSLVRVNCEKRIHILHNNSQTLQAHARIDIFVFQLCVISVSVVIKLGEHVVPHLDVAVALAAYCTSRLSAAIFLAAVIVNLRTGTAGACAVLPEVILSSETENTLCRNSHLLVPDLERLVVVLENRRIETIRIQTHYLC